MPGVQRVEVNAGNTTGKGAAALTASFGHRAECGDADRRKTLSPGADRIVSTATTVTVCPPGSKMFIRVEHSGCAAKVATVRRQSLPFLHAWASHRTRSHAENNNVFFSGAIIACPWPARRCSARHGQSWRMRCETDARPCAGDRLHQSMPPLLPQATNADQGVLGHQPAAVGGARTKRSKPSRLRYRHCTPVRVQSRETSQAPLRRREPVPRSATETPREHVATRRSPRCRPQ